MRRFCQLKLLFLPRETHGKVSNSGRELDGVLDVIVGDFWN